MNRDVSIGPDFSVYRLLERVQEQSLLRSRRTMSLVSYEIENVTIVDGASNIIFAGFQFFSKFVPQIERYRKLAANADTIFVFGVPDITPPPMDKVTYIYLKATDQLAREWFLVSVGPEYESALATEEITEFGTFDDLRQFNGIWTFDPDMIHILYDWISSAIDMKTSFKPNTDINQQFMMMGRTLRRLTKRLDGPNVAMAPEPETEDPGWIEAPDLAAEVALVGKNDLEAGLS